MNAEDWDDYKEEKIDPIINENNRLIALFLGLVETQVKDLWDVTPYLVDNPKSTLPCTIPVQEGLYFHKSYDALIPVVEKIESIHSNHHGYFGVHISSNSCSIWGTNLHLATKDLEGYGYVYCDEVVLDTKLESTYQACLNYINWFNKQNKNEFTFNGVSS